MRFIVNKLLYILALSLLLLAQPQAAQEFVIHLYSSIVITTTCTTAGGARVCDSRYSC